MTTAIGLFVSIVVLAALSIGYLGIIAMALFSMVAAPLTTLILKVGSDRLLSKSPTKNVATMPKSRNYGRDQRDLNSGWFWENSQTG